MWKTTCTQFRMRAPAAPSQVSAVEPTKPDCFEYVRSYITASADHCRQRCARDNLLQSLFEKGDGHRERACPDESTGRSFSAMRMSAPNVSRQLKLLSRSVGPRVIVRPNPMSPARLLLLGYALSGAAALIYEVTWMRLLTLEMGRGVASTSTVLAAFMGGLAIGSAAGGHFGRRISPSRALRIFAIIETAIAALA